MRDEIDALVGSTARITDADVEALPLRSAEADLMEEIMSTPVLESTSDSGPSGRRSVGKRVAALCAAAAVTASAFIIVQSTQDSGPAWAAAVLAAAEEAPRLLVNAPGWAIGGNSYFGADNGEVNVTNAARRLQVRWTPAAEYGELVVDRRASAVAEKTITILGHEAVLVDYGDLVFTTIWQQGAHSIEVVGEGFADRAEYEQALSAIETVGVDPWLSAMPENVVQAVDRDDVVAQMLADISLPSGFDASHLSDGDIQDRYQLGSQVAGSVMCAWIDEFETATQAGDTAAANEAADAMMSSREWAVLAEMNVEGGYPEAIWQAANEIVNGVEPVAPAPGANPVPSDPLAPIGGPAEKGGNMSLLDIHREGLGCGYDGR